MRTKAILLALGAGLMPCNPAHAGDAAAGKESFDNQCSVCHSTALTSLKNYGLII